MNARLILITCSLALSISGALAQGIKSDLREAFEEYNKKRYKAAERIYRKAFTQDSLSIKANLGLGNSLYKRGLYDKALPYYQRAIDHGELQGKEAACLMHNLGNALFKQKEYQKSIEAYKQALTLNPSDDETRYNLVKAQKLLPKQPPQNQPQQNPNNNPEQNPQQNKPEQKPPQDKKDNQEQKSDPKQQPNNPQQQQDNRKINKEQAEKLLDAFKKADEETRRRVEQRKQESEQEQNNKNRRKW